MPDTNNSRLKFALRALRHRNYRLFFAGQSLSMIGTWMTQVATSWLVYRLTNSPFLLGLVGFSGQLPALVLTPFAGVWVDRWNRHRVLKVTQFLSMLESFALAALALTNRINIWHIVGLTMFQGVVNAIDMPARQSFVVEMIEDRADLPSAIALNSSMVNSARLIGPSIAGMIIAVAGEGYCFLIDGFSYLAVIASLLLMRTPASPPRVQQNVLSGLKEGWNYIIGFVPLRSILALVAFVSFAGFSYSVLLPVFASAVLHGGPHTLGFLTGAAGVGALASALTLAMRKTIVGLGKLINILVFTFGAALILFGLSVKAWLSFLLMVPVGFSMMGLLAASNTIMQTIVEEDKRGRVMSFYTLSFTGVMPLGTLIAGTLASRIGAQMTVICEGALCIVAALWFSTRLSEIRRIVRPIYVELGILPEVATGIQAASALQTPPEIVD
ncbi:MAG TPA: MFS transporter [Terriglobia bacterium]|nr:MFS transporter [Terriglobia bacterium]